MFDAWGNYQASTVGVSGAARQYDPDIAAMARAVSKFHTLAMRARFRRLWAILTRRSVRLLDLEDVRRSKTIEGGFDLGCVTIPVGSIRGSESRGCDFDDEFLPLADGAGQRWAGVYAARLCGVPLPAVSVVQVGEIYYVRDGHHRVSVARMLGEEYIEAHVQVWQVRGEPAVAPAMHMRLVIPA